MLVHRQWSINFRNELLYVVLCPCYQYSERWGWSWPWPELGVCRRAARRPPIPCYEWPGTRDQARVLRAPAMRARTFYTRQSIFSSKILMNNPKSAKKQTAERSLRIPKGILERHLRDTWKTHERLPELLLEPKNDPRTSHEHEHFLNYFLSFFFFFRFIKHLYTIRSYPIPNLALLLRSTVEFKKKRIKSNQHILTLLPS